MRAAVEISGENELGLRVDEWLASFEHALASSDTEDLTPLFQSDCYWRDVLAFTWRITTIRGADNVIAELVSRAAHVRALSLCPSAAAKSSAPS